LLGTATRHLGQYVEAIDEPACDRAGEHDPRGGGACLAPLRPVARRFYAARPPKRCRTVTFAPGPALALPEVKVTKFLIVDRAPNTVSALRSLLEGDGHEVRGFTSGEDALKAVAEGGFDAVLVELAAPDFGGALVGAARRYCPRACVFCCRTRPGQVAPDGACHVLDKPIDYHRLARAFEECRAHGGPSRPARCHLQAA
jgi:CheY-like chemotaxis protein